MKKPLYLLFFFILLFYLKINAQVTFLQNNEIKDFNDLDLEDELANPWTGGLNFCQFSEIDLNLDGTKDIFIFDRSGKNGSQNGNKITLQRPLNL